MRVFLSYAVHLFTVSGVFFSFLALIAALERNLPLVFFYLAIALFIDGVDGSLARRINVKEYTPNINGENLDNIIDYLNYVFVPTFVIYWLDLVPEGFELISAATPTPVVCTLTKPWVLLVELIVPLCSIFPALVITRLLTA